MTMVMGLLSEAPPAVAATPKAAAAKPAVPKPAARKPSPKSARPTERSVRLSPPRSLARPQSAGALGASTPPCVDPGLLASQIPGLAPVKKGQSACPERATSRSARAQQWSARAAVGGTSAKGAKGAAGTSGSTAHRATLHTATAQTAAPPATVAGEYAAPDWVLQSSTAEIPVAWDATSVYDPATKQVVLFGGSYELGGSYEQTNGTWLWNGSSWSMANPSTSPPARAGAYMAYDASAQEVVLFGGRNAYSSGSSAWTPLSDTWTWNGSNWTQQFPLNPPSARAYGGMVYDGAIGQSVLYGGAASSSTSTFDSDLWEYKSSTDTWTNPGDSQAPGPRVDQQLGYDTSTGQVVMFGGSNCNPSCAALGDTWTFNGSWTKQAPSSSPPARYLYRVAFDPDAGGPAGGVVLFGGVVTASVALNDTWVWNGTTWLEADGVASPPGTDLQAMAYDGQANQMVVLGGQGTSLWPQTWTYTWSVPTLTQFLVSPLASYLLGAAATVAVGVGNTSGTAMSNVTVTETLPPGLNAAGSTPTVYPGRTAFCVAPVTCDVSASKVVVSGMSIPANGGVPFEFQAIASSASAQCQALTATALAVNSSVAAYGSSTSAPVQAEVCDTGLGSQSWWSYVSEDAGAQGEAAVNVADGNLVVTDQDSTPVQATGSLGLQVRRAYNSQDLAAPVEQTGGELGQGWQLSVVDVGASSSGATGLIVPLAEQPGQPGLSPLAVTLVDDTGTRQVFTLKSSALAGEGTRLSAVPVSFPGDSQSGFLAGLLAPVSIGLPTSGPSGYVGGLLCVDATYQAPPGLDASLYRYVALGAGATSCDEGTHNGVAAVTAGFALVHTNGLRQEFSPDGQLLAVVDRAGNQVRLLYGTMAAGQSVTPGMGPDLGDLAKVYDPAACPTSGCRALSFQYPKPGVINLVDSAGRTTVYAVATFNGVPYLVQVTNPDGSSEQFSYQGVTGTASNGPTSCGGSTGQLCGALDGDAGWTTFSYSGGVALGGGNGPDRAAAIVDRQANYEQQSHPAIPATVSPGSITALTYNDPADYVTADQGPPKATGTSVPYAGCSANGGASACHRALYGTIDGSGRVGEIDMGSASGQTGGATGTYLSQEGYLWDGDSYTVGAPGHQTSAVITCQQPDNGVDNHLCETIRRATPIGAPWGPGELNSGDAVTQYRYNSEGQLLAEGVNTTTAPNSGYSAPGGVISWTTYGAHSQYFDDNAATAVRTFDDTVAGDGSVVSTDTTGPASYQMAVEADNPASLLPLDDTSATTAADVVGTGAAQNNGTYSTGVSTRAVAAPVQGDVSPSFNGINGQVTISDNTVNSLNLAANRPFSVELWVQTQQQSDVVLASKYAAGSAPGWELVMAPDGSIWFTETHSDSQALTVHGLYSVNDGNWHQIVVTGTGSGTSGIKIYVDGQQDTTFVESDNLGSAATTNAGAVTLGSFQGSGFWLAGSLADVAFYPAPLTATQVQAHFSAAASPRRALPDSVLALSDQTQVLSPNGNAGSPSGGYGAYLTTYQRDLPSPSAIPYPVPAAAAAVICAPGATRGNSGLLCETDSPAAIAPAGYAPQTGRCSEPAAQSGPYACTTDTYYANGLKATETSAKANVEAASMTSSTACGAAGAVTACTLYQYYAAGQVDLSATASATNWLETVSDPTGAFVAYAYDAAGNRARTWDRNATAGLSTTSAWSSLGSPPSSTYSEILYGPWLTAPKTDNDAYTDPWRYVVSSRDQLGDMTLYQADSNGNATSEQSPDNYAYHLAHTSTNEVTAMTYDADGNVITDVVPPASVGAPAATSSWTYDAFGNKLSLTDPLGHFTDWAYDSLDEVVAAARDRATAANASQAGNCPEDPTVAGTFPPGTFPPGTYVCYSSTTHDNLGNLVSSTDGDGYLTTYVYDADHRRTEVLTPRYDATYTTLESMTVYDADGNTVETCPPAEFAGGGSENCSPSASPPDHFSTLMTYDPADQLTATTTYRQSAETDGTPSGDFAPDKTSYTYDADNNQVSVTDPDGHTTTTAYDLQDRKTSVTTPPDSPHSDTISYLYDAAGNTTTVIEPPDPSGTVHQTAYSYDPANRRTDTVTGADNVNAAQAGLPDSGGTVNVRTQVKYDNDGNVTESWAPQAFLPLPVVTDPRTDPNPDYMTTTGYDFDDQPVSNEIPRYDTAVAPQVNDSTQAQQCPTGILGYPAATGVCTTSAVYDLAGNLTRVDPPTMATSPTSYTAYSYSDDNLQVSVSMPDPSQTAQGDPRVDATATYDADGQVVQAVSPGSTSGQSVTATSTYTDDGLLSSATQQSYTDASTPITHVTTYTYDANANLTQTDDPDGQVSSTAYYSDNLTAATCQSLTLNVACKLPSVDGLLTGYIYDGAGNPVTIFSPAASASAAGTPDATNPQGKATTNTFYDDNLLATTTVPVATDGLTKRQTAYTYGPGGRTTSATTNLLNAIGGGVNTAGTSQTFTWAPDDRPTSESATAVGSTTPETIAYSYDPAGDTTADTDTGGSAVADLTASYYLDGTVRTVDDSDRTTSYGYDGLGDPTMITEASDNGVSPAETNTTSYSYDPSDLLTSATSTLAPSHPWTATYDPNGLLSTQTDPNGETVADSYWPDDTLQNHQVDNASGTSLADWSYHYDDDGNVTSQTLANAVGQGGQGATVAGANTYGYDAAGRLTGYNGQTIAWDHDDNRLTNYNGQVFTYNSDDSIDTGPAGNNPTATYTYNGAGQLQNDGCATDSYDGFGRLLTVTGTTNAGCDAVTAAYTYDGAGRQRSATETLLQGQSPQPTETTDIDFEGLTNRVAAETSPGTTSTNNYILSPDGSPLALATQNSGLQYLETDGRGNITTVTDATSAVTCDARFDPFGTAISVGGADTVNATNGLAVQNTCNTGTTADTVFYQTARHDNGTGDYQFGSRTYNPSLDAFLTPDMNGPASSVANLSIGVDPLTANTYGYANADPVNLTDPSGHVPCDMGVCGSVKFLESSAGQAAVAAQGDEQRPSPHPRKHGLFGALGSFADSVGDVAGSAVTGLGQGIVGLAKTVAADALLAPTVAPICAISSECREFVEKDSTVSQIVNTTGALGSAVWHGNWNKANAIINNLQETVTGTSYIAKFYTTYRKTGSFKKASVAAANTLGQEVAQALPLLFSLGSDFVPPDLDLDLNETTTPVSSTGPGQTSTGPYDAYDPSGPPSASSSSDTPAPASSTPIGAAETAPAVTAGEPAGVSMGPGAAHIGDPAFGGDGVNVLPSSGQTFVGTPQGTIYDVPSGWAGRVADNGQGIVFQEPGAVGNANSLRIMDPTAQYPNGYVRYYNGVGNGQPLDVFGNPGPPSATHIPQDYTGPWPGWPR